MRSIASRQSVLPLAPVWILLLVMLHTTILRSQSNNGTILGTVTDSSGAAVPNAHIVVKNLETGHEQSATTDSVGGYTIPSLQIGHYSISVDSPGYKTTVLPNIELQVAQQAKID